MPDFFYVVFRVDGTWHRLRWFNPGQAWRKRLAISQCANAFAPTEIDAYAANVTPNCLACIAGA